MCSAAGTKKRTFLLPPQQKGTQGHRQSHHLWCDNTSNFKEKPQLQRKQLKSKNSWKKGKL